MRSFFIATALVVFGFAAPAEAQTARATGTVRDTAGRPVKGATIRAENSEAFPSVIMSTSDDKGRWAMIGLRSGAWTFTVEAPGFARQQASAPIRYAGNPAMLFTLAPDPVPLPGALDKNILQQLAEASVLREQGRYDQAIAAYQTIRSKNPKLTTVNLVMADVYREKATREEDATERRTLLERAISAYEEVLSADASNTRAKSGLAATKAEAAGRPSQESNQPRGNR